MEILHCSSRWSVPTSKQKMQLASMWSISCNIQHLTHQQSQLKIQWSMLQKEPFTTTGKQIRQIDKSLHTTTSWSEWRQSWLWSRNGWCSWTIAQLGFRKDACGGETTRNTSFKQCTEGEMDWGFSGQRDHSVKKASSRCRDSNSAGAGRCKKCWKDGIDNPNAWNNMRGDVECRQR